MRLLSRAYKLPVPGRAAIRRTYEQVKGIHGAAYGWEPPRVGSPPYTSSTSMREYVRWWITEWDLRRLFPGYQPHIEVTALSPDLSEDSSLEMPDDTLPLEMEGLLLDSASSVTTDPAAL
jgi:hypothetical protein